MFVQIQFAVWTWSLGADLGHLHLSVGKTGSPDLNDFHNHSKTYKNVRIEATILKSSPEYHFDPTQLFQRGMMLHPLQYKNQYRLQPRVRIIFQTCIFCVLQNFVNPNQLKRWFPDCKKNNLETMAYKKCHWVWAEIGKQWKSSWYIPIFFWNDRRLCEFPDSSVNFPKQRDLQSNVLLHITIDAGHVTWHGDSREIQV